MGGTMLLIMLILLPALVGAQLSSRVRRTCFIGGLLVGSLLVLVAPSGADAIVYRLGAMFFIGIGLGAGIREGFSLLSRRKRGNAHG